MGINLLSNKLDYTVTVIALKLEVSESQTGKVVTAFGSAKPLKMSPHLSLCVCVCFITLHTAGEDTCSSVDFPFTTLSWHVSCHSKNRQEASKQATSLLS